ncbi:MAG TPA: DegT/DnrJ/EryC1/StrS family aminotransferase [Candidatus Margulisiibacteriota bacterium]|nr:DegT/DnrJ/EryC1/StrS family aminotransferase [Candidatus Margulisiibacteriota bacterium]
MSIPLLDLRREYAAIETEVREAWAATLASMHLLKGENGAAFEREIAAYIGTPYARGVASGTDALLLSVVGLGIGTGDEVIIHANAFAAAVEAVHHAGARPVLVDVEADGLGPDLDGVEQAISPRTRALLIVHLYGSPLPMASILETVARHNLFLIEDCSHAHGAGRDGRKVGTFGRVGCFSSGVVKNLGAYGDAGFITTADAELHTRVCLLGTHGQEHKNRHVLYGFNSRLDELQAALLRVKLRHLDARNRRRAAIAAYYNVRFASLDLRVRREQPGEVHVYHQYVVRSAQRDRLQAYLKAAGIETGIHYPVPLHRHPAWLRNYGESAPLPRAERLAREILSLPVFPDLTDAEVEQVADAVAGFFRSR